MKGRNKDILEWSGCPEVEFWPMDGSTICILRGTSYHPDLIVDTYLQGDSLQTMAKRFYDWTPEQVQAVLDHAQARKPDLFLRDRIENFDWSGCSEVEQIPGKCSGAPVLRSTRFFAEAILELHQDGYTAEAIVKSYELDVKQVQSVIDYILSHGRV